PRRILADESRMSATSSPIGTTGMGHLEHLLNLLEQQAACFSDRRGERRLPTQSPATLETIGPDGQRQIVQHAWVTDISRTGVGLILEQPVETKTEVLLNLTALTEVACVLPIQVVYCRKLMSRTHRVG